jgi:hypothetical protein
MKSTLLPLKLEVLGAWGGSFGGSEAEAGNIERMVGGAATKHTP